jgi:hypothetical protein
MKHYKEFINEGFSAPRFWVKNNRGTFAVVDRENKDKMVVGYSKLADAEKTATGLLGTDESELDDVIKNLKSTKGYGMFLQEGTMFTGGRSYSQNADKLAVYNDMTPDQREELDAYCKMQYGKRFQNCSYDEQSTARSYVWSEKENPKEIQKQNQRDAKM